MGMGWREKQRHAEIGKDRETLRTIERQKKNQEEATETKRDIGRDAETEMPKELERDRETWRDRGRDRELIGTERCRDRDTGE